MDALNTFATGGLGDAIGFVGNFLVLLVIAALLFLFALRAGRSLLISFILSLYVGYALFTVFPYKDMIITGDTPLVRAVCGIALFAAFSFFPYLLLRRVSSAGTMRINPLMLAALTLVTGGFILALGYHVLNIAAVIPLTPSLDALFAPEKYFFWWFLAPLAGVYLTAR
jgi:hypothetical protein